VQFQDRRIRLLRLWWICRLTKTTYNDLGAYIYTHTNTHQLNDNTEEAIDFSYITIEGQHEAADLERYESVKNVCHQA
jgi:hypothetical protein